MGVIKFCKISNKKLKLEFNPSAGFEPATWGTKVSKHARYHLMNLREDIELQVRHGQNQKIVRTLNLRGKRLLIRTH